ncbi:hypothetical protein X975_14308, partial [Stegodyphus mimosarum]
MYGVATHHNSLHIQSCSNHHIQYFLEHLFRLKVHELCKLDFNAFKTTHLCLRRYLETNAYLPTYDNQKSGEFF